MELFTILYFACRVLVRVVGRLKYFKLFPKLKVFFKAIIQAITDERQPLVHN